MILKYTLLFVISFNKLPLWLHKDLIPNHRRSFVTADASYSAGDALHTGRVDKKSKYLVSDRSCFSIWFYTLQSLNLGLTWPVCSYVS